MDGQDMIPLPMEYNQRIIDEKGNVLDVAANSVHLLVRTLAGESGTSDLMRQIDTICIPLGDTLRLIMTIACVAYFSGGFDEKTNELLRAIEVIARHEIM